MGDWFSSLFGGQNKTLNTDINKVGSLGDFSTKVGEGDTTAASKFYQDILSGDPSRIASSLAPEISSGQTQGQQAKQGLAQFGTRSGGTAAATAGIDAGTRGNLINLEGGLQQGAAQGAGSLGTANLGMAANDTMNQAKLAQQRMQNLMDSILGKGISSGLGTLESWGLGKLPGQSDQSGSGGF